MVLIRKRKSTKCAVARHRCAVEIWLVVRTPTPLGLSSRSKVQRPCPLVAGHLLDSSSEEMNKITDGRFAITTVCSGVFCAQSPLSLLTPSP